MDYKDIESTHMGDTSSGFVRIPDFEKSKIRKFRIFEILNEKNWSDKIQTPVTSVLFGLFLHNFLQ